MMGFGILFILTLHSASYRRSDTGSQTRRPQITLLHLLLPQGCPQKTALFYFRERACLPCHKRKCLSPNGGFGAMALLPNVLYWEQQEVQNERFNSLSGP